MNAAEIAHVLEEIGRLLAFRGDNPFKIRAYRNAARTLRDLDEDIGAVIAEGRLRRLPGVGPALAGKIETLARAGTLPLWERLRREVPPGLVDMAAVPGLGRQRARAVFETLGIASLDELEAAAAAGRLAEVPGLGPKTVAAVLAGAGRLRGYAERHLAFVGRSAAAILLDRLLGHPAVVEAAIAGSVRRRLETVGDVDVVASSADPAAVLDALASWPTVAAVESRRAPEGTLGEAHARVRLSAGLPADVYVVAPGAFGAALVRATGSDDHWRRLETLAAHRRLPLAGPDAGVGGAAAGGGAGPDPALGDETLFYARLGLVWIPPELREDRGEVASAAAGALPALVERADIRGAVHVHSEWSDGRSGIAELARAAADRGFEYLVICDHSRSAHYAGGLSIDDLVAQQADIAAVNTRGCGCRVLHGCEVDILPDGALDYPDEVLAGLDVVVASLHGRFRLSREEQTERVVRALENPWVDILGHPTGRLLLRREEHPLDMERVLDSAAGHGAAIEINCDPRRMDLDWRWHRAAAERGIRLSIDPDAHGPRSLDYVEEGVAMARKGGLTAADVLNARPLDDFVAALRRHR